ncbi:MAG TPA: hypothetical protein VGB17_16015 [Pyrinomonadaceae bacterium]|jgi:hypothetical protein
MKDYLWDKTGAEDEQVKRLEQTLGSLSYRPKPFALPAQPEIQKPARRFSFPMLAAAAALLFLLLAGGLWLELRQGHQDRQVVTAHPENKQDQNRAAEKTSTVANKETERENSGPKAEEKPFGSAVKQQLAVRLALRERKGVDQSRQRLNGSSEAQSLARRQADAELLREAESAKALLIKALHIASDKLNLAQKRIRNSRPPEPSS